MQRPPSIINFERSFWASILIGIVGTLFHWQMMTESVKNNPVMSESADMAVTVIGFAIVMSFALSSLLWYLIARRASRVTKWIYVLLMGFGSISTLISINDPMAPQGFALALMLVSAAQTFLSIYFLFRPDASEWFKGGHGVDPETFR
jgi:hypothetical protein